MDYNSESYESRRWSLNGTDLVKILKVLGWSTASSAVGYILITVAQIDVPAQYSMQAAIAIPLINTALVALQKWMAGHASSY
jgi:hypothetical protein